MAIAPVSRRSALRGAAVRAVAAVVGFVVARASPAASSSPPAAANGYGPASSSGGRPLARLDQVPQGGGIVLPRQTIVLTRQDGETVRAFSATCTHQGCP